MVAMRKHSFGWIMGIAAALLGIFGVYAFLGNQSAQAQSGNSPIGILQQQVKELQFSQKSQDAALLDLEERVVILEVRAIGGGGGGGGAGGGGTGGDADQDRDSYTPNQGDCDDFNAKIHPGALEILDGKDNDCNGIIDDIL